MSVLGRWEENNRHKLHEILDKVHTPDCCSYSHPCNLDHNTADWLHNHSVLLLELLETLPEVRQGQYMPAYLLGNKDHKLEVALDSCSTCDPDYSKADWVQCKQDQSRKAF
ncbi:hypothetical protein ACLKA7_004103 [Drosophila subpalustris]